MAIPALVLLASLDLIVATLKGTTVRSCDV